MSIDPTNMTPEQIDIFLITKVDDIDKKIDEIKAEQKTGVAEIKELIKGQKITCDKKYASTGRFTIAASQALELQHYCTSTKTTTGFGAGNTFGTDNVFAYLVFRKVG